MHSKDEMVMEHLVDPFNNPRFCSIVYAAKDSRDTIPIRPAANQVLSRQNIRHHLLPILSIDDTS